MKKETFIISEKHERITIQYRRKQKRFFTVCEKCGKKFESLTVDEAADLIGKDADYVRRNLKILRRKEK